jgi:hypothetical protein
LREAFTRRELYLRERLEAMAPDELEVLARAAELMSRLAAEGTP